MYITKKSTKKFQIFSIGFASKKTPIRYYKKNCPGLRTYSNLVSRSTVLLATTCIRDKKIQATQRMICG